MAMLTRLSNLAPRINPEKSAPRPNFGLFAFFGMLILGVVGVILLVLQKPQRPGETSAHQSQPPIVLLPGAAAPLAAAAQKPEARRDAVPMVYRQTRVKELVPRYDKRGQTIPGHHVITFENPVPNDDGYVVISLENGTKVRLTLSALLIQPYEKKAEGSDLQAQLPGPARGKSTATLYVDDTPEATVLYARDASSKTGVLADQLKHRPAQVFSKHYPNLEPSKGGATGDANVVEARIESISPRYGRNGQVVEARYVVTLSREVPNEAGILQISIRDGQTLRLPAEPLLVVPYRPEIKYQAQIPGPARGKPTTQLYVDLDSEKAADASSFRGAQVRFITSGSAILNGKREKEPQAAPADERPVPRQGLICKTFELELDRSGVGRGAGGGMFRLTITDMKGDSYLLESVPVKDDAGLIETLLHRIAVKKGEGGWTFDAVWYPLKNRGSIVG